MNIFWLADEPDSNAMSACDQHLVKMCIEYAQMLCTTLHWLGYKHPNLYKATHENHPCTLWVKSSPWAFTKLYSLLVAYDREYRDRFGKTESHASFRLMETIVDDLHRRGLELYTGVLPSEYRGNPYTEYLKVLYLAKGTNPRTIDFGPPTPPMCMPEEYQHHDPDPSEPDTMTDVIQSYREYYARDKTKVARYRTGDIPRFLINFAKLRGNELPNQGLGAELRGKYWVEPAPLQL